MKRSEILFRVVIALFIALVVTVFVLLQEVLSNTELFFLWAVMTIVGWLWIQALADGSKVR